MGTEVDVFDIDRQKHLGKVAVSQLDMKYDQWRTKGYDDLIYGSGDVCIDDEDTGDDGPYYKQQLEEPGAL